MYKQSQQQYEVHDGKVVLLFYAYNLGWVGRVIDIYFTIPREESKLEQVFHYHDRLKHEIRNTHPVLSNLKIMLSVTMAMGINILVLNFFL